MPSTPAILLRTTIGAALLSACAPQPAPDVTFGPCSAGKVYAVKGVPRTCAAIPGTGEDSTLAVTVEGTELVIGLHNVADGTKLSVGSATGTSANGDLVVRLPITDKLDALTVPQLIGKQSIDLGLSLELALARHEKRELKIPSFTLGWAMHDRAQDVLIDHKLGLGATAPATPSVFLAARGLPAPVVGNAKTLAEIDWIAVFADKPSRTTTCEYMDRHGVPRSVKKRVDVKGVTIHDRRTGTVIDSKEFAAIGKCPSTYTVGRGDIRIDFARTESFEQVLRWLRGRVAPASVATSETGAPRVEARPATIEKRPARPRARPAPRARKAAHQISNLPGGM